MSSRVCSHCLHHLLNNTVTDRLGNMLLTPDWGRQHHNQLICYHTESLRIVRICLVLAGRRCIFLRLNFTIINNTGMSLQSGLRSDCLSLSHTHIDLLEHFFSDKLIHALIKFYQ